MFIFLFAQYVNFISSVPVKSVVFTDYPLGVNAAFLDVVHTLHVKHNHHTVKCISIGLSLYI